MVRPTTIRVVLSLALTFGWSIRQLDVNNTFFHGDLNETVYTHQPPGFIDSTRPDHICLLSKAIYGLKQSLRAWFNTLSTTLLDFSFVGSQYDPSLFVLTSNGHTLVVLVYVDDILVTDSNSTLMAELIATLHSRFALKDLGHLHYFLGIEVSSSTNGFHLSQTKYIGDLLNRANMVNTKPCPSPMSANTSLSKFDEDPLEDPHLYRTIVGALQYTTITRPDITFAVNKVSQFMHNPTTSHWTSVKRILHYLAGSPSHGIFIKPCHTLEIHAYCDADWAGCPDDRRSTSAFCIFLGSNIISWSSKKQYTVARSSTEFEYRSLALSCTELVWLQFLLDELHVQLQSPPTLWCDNIGTTFLASNPAFHARTKHVEIDFHFIRERVLNRSLLIRFISSQDQIADILIKGLTTPRFLSPRSKLTVTPVPSACGGGGADR